MKLSLFLEEKLVFVELMPMKGGPEKMRKFREYNPEIPKEVKEREEKERKESQGVAEKIIDEVELMGIKCEKCGLKNVKIDKEFLWCPDCGHKWKISNDGKKL